MKDWLVPLLMVGYGLFAVFAVRAIWRDIARWEMSSLGRVMWMFFSLTPVGLLLWIFVSNSERKRRRRQHVT